MTLLAAYCLLSLLNQTLLLPCLITYLLSGRPRR